MARRAPGRLGLAVVVACCALVIAGCASDGTTTPAGGPAGEPSGQLVVLAAASLTEPFEELGRAYEALHPGVTVTFSFAGSSDLARQINDGARADVFASADQETMASVVDAGNASGPVVAARNQLAMLVEKGNPRRVRTLADLVAPDLVLVMCAHEVPCGRLAAAAFRSAGVTPRPASLEENVKAVVAKVVLGEADAGIVYRSDVEAARDRADGVDLAPDPDLVAVYPLAVTTAAANRPAARSWVAFVLSRPGRRTLADAGFLAP